MNPDTLEFKFENKKEKDGNRTFGKKVTPWYKWTVYMDEDGEKLASVKHVEYRLHDTFPNPIRFSKDVKSKFALSSAGWGEFTIFITVYLIDGQEVETTHRLNLIL